MAVSSYSELTNGVTSLTNYPQLLETSTFNGYLTSSKVDSYFIIPVSYADNIKLTFSGVNVEDATIFYSFGDASYIKEFTSSDPGTSFLTGGANLAQEGNGSNGQTVNSQNLGTVSASSSGGFRSWNGSQTVLTKSGTGYLIIQVYGNALDNLTQDFTLQMQGAVAPPPPPANPDLVFTSFALSANTMAYGGVVNLNYTIKNSGAASAAASTIEIYFSSSATFNKATAKDEGAVSFAALAAGSSVTGSIADTVDLTAGQYYVYLYENQSGSVSSAGSLKVTGASQPDLVVQTSSVSAASLPANSTLSVSYTVENQGNASAPASQVGIYFCDSIVFDAASAIYHTDVALASLAAGSQISQTTSISIPTTFAQGTYYVFVVANDTNTFTESNANNNVSSWNEITIKPPQLFSTSPDVVNFNLPYLSTLQIADIKAGADKYDGLGGADTVTLPTEANETENLGGGTLLNWRDSLNSLFHTSSLAGQAYTVNGSDGDYFIQCGAGNDTINISNPTPNAIRYSYNTIVGGSGDDVINIHGANGDNAVTAGTGPLTLNIDGFGNNKLQVEGAEPPTISGNVVTTQNPNFANNGSFTFQFLLDADDSFNGALTGDGEFQVMGGHLAMHGGSAFTGEIDIEVATLELTSANCVGSGHIVFENNLSGSVLQIDGTVMPTNTIVGFIPSFPQTIDLRSVPFTGNWSAVLAAGNVLQITPDLSSPHVVYLLQLDPTYDYTGVGFALTDDGRGGSDIIFGDVVASGQVDNDPTVNPDTALCDYGHTNECTVDDGGVEEVRSGGVAYTTTVKSGGKVIVGTSGKAVGLLIDTGGTTTILAGGLANTPTIQGAMTVVSGGKSTGGSIGTGGNETVYGAVLTVMVNSGGTLTIGKGGVANNVDVLAGGLENIQSGGKDNGATIYGAQEIFAGGVANGDTIYGVQKVDLGGKAVASKVGANGTQNVYGTSLTTKILAGGLVNIESGGTGHSITIAFNGSENVSGKDFDAVVNGEQLVELGGVAYGAIVNGGALQAVLAGGSAFNTTVAGGTLNDFGKATNTFLSSGNLTVGNGAGVSIGSQIASGASETVQSGCKDEDGVVKGTQTIEFGGIANSVSLQGATGAQYDYGKSFSAIVGTGAVEIIESGGTAVGSTISTGSSAQILSGGAANAFTLSGGSLEVEAGGAATGTLTFSGPGGELQLDTTTAIGATLSGFGTGDVIDFRAIAFDTQSSTVGFSGGTLMITDGSHSAALALIGSYQPTSFTTKSDGHNGTEILLSGLSFSALDETAAANGSEPLGVNNSGEVVGTYYDSGGAIHAYVYTPAGGFANDDLPALGPGGGGFGATTANGLNGVNAAGELVGYYANTTGTHGVYHYNAPVTGLPKLDISSLNDPSATAGTVATGINSGELIVGHFAIGAESYGFSETNNNFTTIQVGSQTFANADNNSGQIVGDYVDAQGHTHGFLDTGGTISSLDDPNASGLTVATGINNEGEIVGYFRDASNAYHGFTDQAGVYTTVNDPAASAFAGVANTGTILTGLNDMGQFVGAYGNISSGVGLHGFIATSY